MSLLEKIRAITVRSLNARVLIAMMVILSLSFLAFNMVSNRMQTRVLNPLFNRFDELQLRSAQEAYEENGKAALHQYLIRLDATFGGDHYLLNSSGVDLFSGEDRRALLPPGLNSEWRAKGHGAWIIAHRSEDGRYWFTATGQAAPTRIWAFLPYYFIVLGATGILGWIAWIGIVLPITRRPPKAR